MIDRLLIARTTYDALVNHLIAALPNEGCGLLATVDAAASRQVVRFYPGENIDRSPTRFTMDPRQVAAALDEIEVHGWALGAIAHSHPRTAATPSATDLREAYHPDALLVIVSFAGEKPEIAVWDVAGGTGPGRARPVAIAMLAD